MMKKVIYIFIALFLLSCGSNNTANISTETTAEISSPVVTVQSILSDMENESYREGEVLVKFKSGVSSTQSLSSHQSIGATVAKRFNIVPELKLVKLPAGMSVSDAVIQYMSDPNVEYAEPNYIMQLFATPKIPNDTYFHQQWALDNQGKHFGGTMGADIDAPEAWDIFTGTTDVIVAVIDSGINYNHEDLVGNIWQNEDEGLGDANGDGFPGIKDVDDDGDGLIDEDSTGLQPADPGYTNDLMNDDDENGYEDDLIGWDFVGSDIDTPVEDANPMDELGHGTHVAGIIGGRGNNNTGITGVNWESSLMAIKIGGTTNEVSISDAADAVDYAVSNGAFVINASFGGSTFYNSMFDAISAANIRGVLFVASAGNDGNNNDLAKKYPAAYDLDNIIAVAATDQNDMRASFSNYGVRSVDVGAPGVYILSTIISPNNVSLCTRSGYAIYDFCSGTSMSAPHVSGLAGLLWSYYTDFTHSQIKDTILEYGDPLNSLNGWVYTGKRINADKALRSLLTPTILSATFSSGISLSWSDNATGEDGYKIERNVSDSGYVPIATIGPDSTYTDNDVNSSTTYSYRVIAYNNIRPQGSFYSNVAIVPIAPTDLSATAVSENQINLSWLDKSGNETGFKIERKDDIGGTYTLIDAVGEGETTYSDTALNKAKTYFYRVLAYTSTGSSAYSNEDSAKTQGKSSTGGGNCSIGSRQNTPTAMANIAVLLIPLAFMAIIRLKRRYRGQKV